MDYIVGVDIGGTNTKIGLVNMQHNVVEHTRFRTTSCTDYDEFITNIVLQIKNILPNGANLLGIGIGAPNGNYYSGSVEHAPNMPFKGILPIRESVANHFNCKVALTNDANAAAMGEKIYGAAKEYNDFIVITLGTGVGSGIYCNGKLVYGHDGFAGELGHVIVYPNGRLCGCGRNGCLEPYANQRGIMQTYEELKKNYPNSSLLNEEKLNAKIISEHAKKGDALGLAVYQKTGEHLGFAFANFMAFLSPKSIFLYGGISRAGEILRQPIIETMESYMLGVFKNKLEINYSQLPDDDAAILGAAALISH